MITFKIYNLDKFEETHQNFFHLSLDVLSKANYLSPSIDEIIITDDLPGEIARYSQNRVPSPNVTHSREFKAIAKTIDFDGKKKIFFDAYQVNGYFKYGVQIFFEQLIEVFAEDLVTYNYKAPTQFTASTLLTDVIKIFFSQWATKVVSNIAEEMISLQREKFFADVKMFVNAFKRNIRKLHYKYQNDVALDEFWIKAITEVDFFIRRCFDVKYDEGSFESLQEFSEIIPPLLTEIEIQTQKQMFN